MEGAAKENLKEIVLDNEFLCDAMGSSLQDVRALLRSYALLGDGQGYYDVREYIEAEIVCAIANGIACELGLQKFYNPDFDDEYNKEAIPWKLSYHFDMRGLHDKIAEQQKRLEDM